jgi:hypothetical protein
MRALAIIFPKMTQITKFLTFLLLTPGLISCGQSINKSNSEQTNATILAFDTSKIAILPFHNTLGWPFKDCGPAELTTKDIALIEAILTKCIEENKPIVEKKFRNFTIDLKRYKRQYTAVTNKKGEIEIWINCFCETFGRDWKTNQILVKDGGNCYFNVKINLTTGKYYDFMINGEA